MLNFNILYFPTQKKDGAKRTATLGLNDQVADELEHFLRIPHVVLFKTKTKQVLAHLLHDCDVT